MPNVWRRMANQRALQQARGRLGIIEQQMVNRSVDQRPRLTRHKLYRLEFRTAPTAGVGAVEHGTAERATLHRLGLKIKQKILKLLATTLQRRVVATASRVADRLNKVNNFRAILGAGDI